MGLAAFRRALSFHGVHHSSLRFPITTLAPCSGHWGLAVARLLSLGPAFTWGLSGDAVCERWDPQHVTWAAEPMVVPGVLTSVLERGRAGG